MVVEVTVLLPGTKRKNKQVTSYQHQYQEKIWACGIGENVGQLV